MEKYIFIFFICFLFGCVPDQHQLDKNPFILSENQAPMIIAHGGLKALFPENTMVAFDGAMDIGVDALEMDVSLTKDKQLITHHDETIDDMSDGSGKVIDYTFEELLQFNFGDGFVDIDGNNPYQDSLVACTLLEDVIVKYGHVVPLMIEIKDEGENGRTAADELFRLIQTYGIASTTVVYSFDDEVIKYFNSITQNTIATGCSREETEDFVYSGLSSMEFLYQPKSSILAIPTESSGIHLNTKRIIKSAHRRNMAIFYWTIDDYNDMKDLILKGADGLMTDRADIMHQVLDDLGY